MSARFRWLSVALLAVLPLAGCGGGSSDTPAAAGAADPGAAAVGGDDDGGGGGGGGGKAGDCDKLSGATVCFHYDLTGAVTASGTLAGNVGTNNGISYDKCSEWVKGEPGGDDDQPALYMPSGGPYQPGDKFGGLSGNVIEHYHGPGTYQKKDLSGQGSPSGIILPASPDSFTLQGSSTGTVTINPDGSGEFTFDKLGTGQYGHPQTVSGRVSWTCHDA